MLTTVTVMHISQLKQHMEETQCNTSSNNLNEATRPLNYIECICMYIWLMLCNNIAHTEPLLIDI